MVGGNSVQEMKLLPQLAEQLRFDAVAILAPHYFVLNKAEVLAQICIEVGSTFNYTAPLYYQLIEAFKAGDLVKVRKLQEKSIETIQLWGKYGGIATGKAFMRAIGLDCGQFRLPVQNMTGSQYEAFLEDLGFPWKLLFQKILSREDYLKAIQAAFAELQLLKYKLSINKNPNIICLGYAFA